MDSDPDQYWLELFEEVKKYIGRNLDSVHDLQVLAAIAKTEKGELNYHKLDNSLQMINVHTIDLFDGVKTPEDEHLLIYLN